VPELPEVQTVVDNLNGLGIGGSTITNASVHWPKTVAPITPAKFRKQIKGLELGGNGYTAGNTRACGAAAGPGQ